MLQASSYPAWEVIEKACKAYNVIPRNFYQREGIPAMNLSIISLYLYTGLSVTQIAELLSLSEDRIYKGLRRLDDQFGESPLVIKLKGIYNGSPPKKNKHPFFDPIHNCLALRG